MGGGATETGIAFDVSAAAPAPVGQRGCGRPAEAASGIDDELPLRVGRRLAERPAAVERATLTLGAARPATTVSPAGSTLTTSKAGLTGAGAGAAGAGVSALAGAEGGSEAGFDCAISVSGTGGESGHRKSGETQKIPATPTTATAAPVAPAQISADGDGMLFRFRAQVYATKALRDNRAPISRHSSNSSPSALAAPARRGRPGRRFRT